MFKVGMIILFDLIRSYFSYQYLWGFFSNLFSKHLTWIIKKIIEFFFMFMISIFEFFKNCFLKFRETQSK